MLYQDWVFHKFCTYFGGEYTLFYDNIYKLFDSSILCYRRVSCKGYPPWYTLHINDIKLETKFYKFYLKSGNKNDVQS